MCMILNLFEIYILNKFQKCHITPTNFHFRMVSHRTCSFKGLRSRLGTSLRRGRRGLRHQLLATLPGAGQGPQRNRIFRRSLRLLRLPG